MSEKVTIAIDVDTTEAETELLTLQERVDAQVNDWRIKRQMIINQLQEINRGISLAIQALRMAIKATGQALDPMQSALLALIGSTASIIITTSIALAMASFGLLVGVALALAAFAYGMQIAETAKAVSTFLSLKEKFGSMDADIARLQRNIPGGLGGF